MSEGRGVDRQADGNEDARHQNILVGDQVWRLVFLKEALLPSQLPLALRLLPEQGRRTRSSCVPVLPGTHHRIAVACKSCHGPSLSSPNSG